MILKVLNSLALLLMASVIPLATRPAPAQVLTTHDAAKLVGITIGLAATDPTAIAKDEAITGSYLDPIMGNPFGGNLRGFLWTRAGDFSTFDAATHSPCSIWTFPEAINPEGAISGYHNDATTAFIRIPLD